jgi:large subunit ribosomal protein L22
MKIIAEQKNTRQSPRKVRLVANSVRKLPLEKAIEQLSLIERRATLVVLKVLRQALANAWHNHGFKAEDVTLVNILVTEGPRYKRFRAVSRGRGHGVVKKTCHIKVILETKSEAKKATKQEIKKSEEKKDKKKIIAKTAVKPELQQIAKQNITKKTDKTRRKV